MTGCPLLDMPAARQNGKRLPCERLAEENAKLREQLESVVGRSFRTADKMERLEAENVKLRELVRDMADAIADWYELMDGAFACESVYEDEKFAPLFDRMRELGVDE